MANAPIVFVNGGNGYQPDRQAQHGQVADVWTSPHDHDYSYDAGVKVYGPLGRLGMYQDMSYSAAPPLRRELRRVATAYPDTRSEIEAATAEMEQYMPENGVAMPAVHAILPHQSDIDKRILVWAGINDYMSVTGRAPTSFWLPESAVDDRTLEVLVEAGIQAIICAPEQVGSEQPRRITLGGGRNILALPFNTALSRQWSFDSECRTNAESFAQRVLVPILDRLVQSNDLQLLLLWLDTETHGMYDPQKEIDPNAPGSEYFLEHFVRVILPRMGIELKSVNRIIEQLIADPERIPGGAVRPNTAWSCSKGLNRWDGTGDCPESGGEEWKRPFYAAHAQLNDAVTRAVRREMGYESDSREVAFAQRIASNFNGAFANRGGVHSATEESLESAKVAALVGLASCGTFYDSPNTSGWMNMVFARAAVEHLYDAGLRKEADAIWRDYMETMGFVPEEYFVRGSDWAEGAEVPLRRFR